MTLRPHHALLERQLCVAFGSASAAPPALAPLLALVDDAYRQADVERNELATMQRALERSRALLAEAQEIARLGTWDYDVVSERANWSAELYRIYGAEPSDAPLTWESITAIV